MILLGFETLEELVEWLNEPDDPQALSRCVPARIVDDSDPDE